MKNLITLTVLFIFVSCASNTAPNFSKVHKYETKQLNPDMVKAFFIRNIKDSDNAIKLSSDKMFIVKSNTECNIFRQWGDPKGYNLKFTLQVNFFKGKTNLNFSNLEITHKNGKAVGWAYNQISSKEKLEKAKECTQSIIESLK